MLGIRPLACRRLTGSRHQNIWCGRLSGILRARSHLKRQMNSCSPTTRKTQSVMNLTALRRRIRFLRGSQHFFPSGRSALRRMSISPFIGNCSPTFILTQDGFGIITSRRKNGCWTVRPCSTAGYGAACDA